MDTNRTGNNVVSEAPTVAQVEAGVKTIKDVKAKLEDVFEFIITDYEKTGNESMLVASMKVYEAIKLMEGM